MKLLEKQMIELDDNGFQNPLQGNFPEIKNRVEQKLNPVFCFRRRGGRQAGRTIFWVGQEGSGKTADRKGEGRARGMAGQIGICRAST
jgi:hypothetical protein